MAVIQDLQTELLYHILELAEGGKDMYFSTRFGFLRLASLVARQWTAPAQRLMLKQIVIGPETMISEDKLVGRLSQPGAAQLVKRVRLDAQNGASLGGYERILEKLGTSEELVVAGELYMKLSAEALRVELLQDLKYFTLVISTYGALPRLTGPLSLTSLRISRTRVWDSVLRPLLANVPSLHCLSVSWDGPDDSSSEMTHFNLVAPQLRSLSFLHYEGTWRAKKVPAVADFLAKCTSLVDLHIRAPPRGALSAYLRAMNEVNLSHLETVLLSAEDARLIACTLSFPAFEHLKTWKFVILRICRNIWAQNGRDGIVLAGREELSRIAAESMRLSGEKARRFGHKEGRF
ncbi:hypothetical protein BCR35DRAFT_329979 [Leucosporidium creatinivorum]|uniref:F-box domain-containing protein n=1 Tax=Leucosporidium creatinivorum TaxID=106004 RepID=A0A1Y2FZ04_9BASI|nr:hypothetical protein BCR35DRAFT_329979 [Leucosporidium creatinivorum]